MNSLNVSNINLRSPYTVWEENGEYVFISENNILYAVGFEYDDSIRYGALPLYIKIILSVSLSILSTKVIKSRRMTRNCNIQ